MSSRSPGAELIKRIDWALPALATLAMGIVRLPELTRSSLWYDELFSIGVAGLPLGDSLRRIIADHTNPPLFYLLLKGWMFIGGDGDRWVRLLPCLFAMFLGAALVWLARESRAGALAGTLAVALAVVSPLSVDLATEVRAYSLLALVACLSLAAALYDRRLHTRHSFALFTLLNIALVHTHYFGWLTIGAECLVSLLAWGREPAWRVARSAALALLAFLPWAGAVAAHALSNAAPLRNVAWITAPGLMAPVGLLRDLTGRSAYAAADAGWVFCVAVALAALGVGQWRHRRRDVTPSPAAGPGGTLLLLAVAGFVAPLGVWAASLVTGHSLWVTRYFMGAAAPLALLVAIAIAALPPRRWAAAGLAGFVWCAVALAALPQRPPVKFDWRRFARRIDLTPGSPRDVYALEAFTGAPLQHYAPAGVRLHVVHALADIDAGDAWLVYRPQSFTAAAPTDQLRALGFTTVTLLSAETVGQKIVAVRVRRRAGEGR